MIAQAVAVLVIGKQPGRQGFPMQHLHRHAPGLDGDDIQAGTIDIARFQPRQVTGFTDHRTSIGLQHAHLSLAHAISSVDVALRVIGLRVALYRRDLMQLITYIPMQCSCVIQRQQIAVVIKRSGYFSFCRWPPVPQWQAPIAVLRSRQYAPMLLWPLVGQFKQVTAFVIAISLAVIGHGPGGFTVSGAPVITAGLPTRGCDQLAKAVVDIARDRFDTLVGEEAHRQRLVFDTEDIAHRVITVVQVLQTLAVEVPGTQTSQSPIFRAVVEQADHLIARRLLLDPTLGVVTDIAHQQLWFNLAVEQQPGFTQLAIQCLVEVLAMTLSVDLHRQITQRVETKRGNRSVARLQQRIALIDQ
ncbi:hypothetical protein BB029_06350 [Pseudomonas sp. S3E12]|nr:hypothetical protein BB029_06350 [Pseudomonas sp. S3E12]